MKNDICSTCGRPKIANVADTNKGIEHISGGKEGRFCTECGLYIGELVFEKEKSVMDRILEAQADYVANNPDNPPVLLILPFSDYYELQNQHTFDYTFIGVHQDYSVGHLLGGMIIDYDYDATKIIIKGFLKSC